MSVLHWNFYMTPKNICSVFFAVTIISLFFMIGNGHCVSIKIGWNPPQRGVVDGYKLYYGTSSGLYDHFVDVGNTTIKSIKLKKGYQYYIVATAYNEFGESAPSEELPVNTCTYRLSPGKKTMKQTGGFSSVKVTTQPDCNWSAASGSDWLKIIDGESGKGKGVIRYVVESNDTYEPRTVICTFAGKSFTVKQKGKK